MNKIKDHTYHYEHLIIGGNIEAVAYSYVKNIPLIYVRKSKPFRFDSLDRGFDLSLFGIDKKDKILTTRSEDRAIGFYKKELWERLTFMLSLAGNLPFFDKVQSIRFESNNSAKVITTGSRTINITFSNLYVFEDVGLVDFPCEQKYNSDNEKKYKVIDWINVRSGMNHRYDYFFTGEDFVNEIYFYPSDRIDGNHPNRKDIVCVSYMSEEQKDDIEYSDTYIKFKVLQLMKEAGIKGQSNGRDVNNPDRTIYRAIKLEPAVRDIYELGRKEYHDGGNIFFIKESLEEIINNAKIQKNSYTSKLNKNLYKRNRKHS